MPAAEEQTWGQNMQIHPIVVLKLSGNKQEKMKSAPVKAPKEKDIHQCFLQEYCIMCIKNIQNNR